MQLEAQPGEQAPADLAVEGQFEVGLVARQGADLVLVVVGIEQVGEGETQGNHEQQQSEDEQPEQFAKRFHDESLW